MPTIRKNNGITTIIYDIVEDLKGRPAREVILIGHLYLEFMLNSILQTYFCADDSQKRGEWTEIEKSINSFNKIEILRKIGLIDPKIAKQLHAIRDTRNQIGHNLVTITSTYKGQSLESEKVLEEYKNDAINLWTELNDEVLMKISKKKNKIGV